ncbi:hypothetical protein B9Z19DRAFT_1067310 [Tuber borchii]|uniref:Uncharacterized protein n=1 Tax=Tuber borchii TaxID=42251 RepID=A0A2T6ZJB5_TUBBO|nr:hypothetical protein B9Z19DRAFT_1067310 [Tuber borchii]
MKNLAQLYLLAALAVSPSLLAGMSPYPPFSRDLQPMRDPKFYAEIIPATKASGLGKRQTECRTGESLCPNAGWCCPSGNTCVGDTTNPGCQPPPRCGDGYFMCANMEYCCREGHECLPNHFCSEFCGLGGTQCGPDGCCEAGHVCDEKALLCNVTGTITLSIIPSTFQFPTLDTSFNPIISIPTISKTATSSTTPVSSSTTIPTTSKAATSSTTLVDPVTTTPTRPTSTNSDPEPTSSSTTKGENSSSGTESVNTGSSSSTIAPASGSNALKQAGWLGGFGILFFFVFFHM